MTFKEKEKEETVLKQALRVLKMVLEPSIKPRPATGETGL
jgi:hypothetical protein